MTYFFNNLKSWLIYLYYSTLKQYPFWYIDPIPEFWAGNPAWKPGLSSWTDVSDFAFAQSGLNKRQTHKQAKLNLFRGFYTKWLDRMGVEEKPHPWKKFYRPRSSSPASHELQEWRAGKQVIFWGSTQRCSGRSNEPSPFPFSCHQKEIHP